MTMHDACNLLQRNCNEMNWKRLDFYKMVRFSVGFGLFRSVSAISFAEFRRISTNFDGIFFVFRRISTNSIYLNVVHFSNQFRPSVRIRSSFFMVFNTIFLYYYISFSYASPIKRVLPSAAGWEHRMDGNYTKICSR